MGTRSSRCMKCTDEAEEEAAPADSSNPKLSKWQLWSVDLPPDPNRRIKWFDIAKDFKITSAVVGTGKLGVVRLAQNRITNQQVAVKRLCKMQSQHVRSEVQVYLQVDHPNICRLLNVYDANSGAGPYVDLVMELCGVDLQIQMSEQKFYCEVQAVDMMLQMLQAVGYLHSQNIVHRNLKLEHWLCATARCVDRLKLIDFGFARILGGPEEFMEQDLGTLLYVCPEVLSRRYTRKCDIWSLGIICYMLLAGKPPFYFMKDEVRTKDAICQSDFPRDGRWKLLSDDAHHLITQLLQKSASRRPDAPGALRYIQKWKLAVQ